MMQLPARIGKYELQEFLGGGMSHVYRAVDTVLGRTVAVKILTEAGCADSEAKARFLHEARMAGNIVHENIISIYDFGEDAGRPFIVMEFLRGHSLRELIKRGEAGDLRNRLTLALQIARALEYIHSKQIIHRDVKPENIHVDAGGRIKLMDFGIAKSQGMQLTRAGFTLGTPYYMAPEQVLGQQITGSVDIYAFGILLFEVLVGSKPIAAASIEIIFNKILNEPIDMQPLRAAGIPAGVIHIVERCTAKAPADRYATFGDVCVRLERLIENPQASITAQTTARTAPAATSPRMKAQPESAAAAEVPSFLRKLPPFLQTQTGLTVAAAVAAIVLLAILYWLFSLISR